jgi:prepilin-type N-terminal cleavage/methylation domain-containing protein
MDGKQNGFTLIEILVVVTIIGVLAGLVVVLIPKGQFEAKKVECTNNVKNHVSLLEITGKEYPTYAGPNMILYLVKKGEYPDEGKLRGLFCPGDVKDTWDLAGGEEAYKNLDLTKQGEYDHLTSYAGRDQKNRDCRVLRGSSKTNVLICDDSEDHHEGKGFVVGLTGGPVKWRDKVDDYQMDLETVVEIGEGSAVKELECLRRD